MEPCNFFAISRGAICCACSVNFSLMRETAGMRLRRFPTQQKEENKKKNVNVE